MINEPKLGYLCPKGYKQTEVGVIPEDWEAFPLEVIADVIMGQSPSGNTYNKLGNGIALINGPTEFTKVHPVKVQWTTQPTKICQMGDLLICVRGSSTGRMNVSNDEYCIGRGVAAIRANYKSDTVYLTHQIHLGIERLLALSAGSTFANVDGKSIRSIRIPLPPSKAEQEAIAEALSDADALIESLEQLITKKRHLKQGVMQELLTGKKRLPGFSGEWEVKAFNEVCWYQEGPGVRNTQFTVSGVKLLNGTNIFRGVLNLETTNRFISEKEAHGAYAHFLANAGDIVIASSGITIERFHEKVAFVREFDLPFCMNTSTIRFKPYFNILASTFLYQFLTSDSFKQMIGGQATGSAQLNFGPSHLAKIPFLLPPIYEQNAIATILSDMDTEIAALEAKLTKTRSLKQGMMHELLTGKTRLL